MSNNPSDQNSCPYLWEVFLSIGDKGVLFGVLTLFAWLLGYGVSGFGFFKRFSYGVLLLLFSLSLSLFPLALVGLPLSEAVGVCGVVMETCFEVNIGVVGAEVLKVDSSWGVELKTNCL